MSPRIHSLPGPEDITRAVLPNGITILTRSNFASPSVVLSGYMPAGSAFEPLDKLGESLVLPPFLEAKRKQIEAGLKPL